MVGRLKNMVKNLMNPKKTAKLRTWQGRFETAKTAYRDSLDDMDTFEAYYNGTREVLANPNTHKEPKKKATNVRNIVYELIESQVDNSIPMPKVRAVHAGDEELAKNIEHALYNEINKIRYKEMNDLQERTVPVQGGDLFHVEWLSLIHI